MKRIPVASLLILFMLIGFSCSKSTGPTEQSRDSQKEIYIPKDLDECFVELKKMLKPDDIKKMQSCPEKDMIQYHFGIGMWMRNNWGLWGGSRLAKWFNAQGIKHPDDMSGVILDSFWRHLNNKPIMLDEQVNYYQEYWKAQKPIPKAKEESNHKTLP